MLKDMARLKSPNQPAANRALLSLCTKCWTAFCNVIKITLRSESSINPIIQSPFPPPTGAESAALPSPTNNHLTSSDLSLISVFIISGASIQYFSRTCVFIVYIDVKNCMLIFGETIFWCENDQKLSPTFHSSYPSFCSSGPKGSFHLCHVSSVEKTAPLKNHNLSAVITFRTGLIRTTYLAQLSSKRRISLSHTGILAPLEKTIWLNS